MSSSDQLCPFCSIGAEEKYRIVGENSVAVAFLTNTPITPGHTLVVPRRCVPSLFQLPREEVDGVLWLAKRVRGAMLKTCAVGFNFAWNETEIAGQSVPHLHLHIVPRTAGDAGVLGYDPRRFLYRPGSRDESPPAELAEVARMIKSAL